MGRKDQTAIADAADAGAPKLGWLTTEFRIGEIPDIRRREVRDARFDDAMGGHHVEIRQGRRWVVGYVTAKRLNVAQIGVHDGHVNAGIWHLREDEDGALATLRTALVAELDRMTIDVARSKAGVLQG